VAAQGYDSAAASQGTPLAALDDDDTRLAGLPFAFPFFGVTYNQVFVNSDGNLTFTVGDFASHRPFPGAHDRRAAAHLTAVRRPESRPDAGGVRVFANSSRVVVSWVNVPEYAQYGTGPLQTFR